MIVETTNYFALPGREEEVLATRRAATTIRVALGLQPGEILVRLEGDGPNVRWECRFIDRAAYEEDRKARAASPEFEANKAVMHRLLRRFERHLEQTAPQA